MRPYFACACKKHQWFEGDEVNERNEDGWLTEVHRYEFCLTPYPPASTQQVAALGGIPVMLVQRNVEQPR